MTNAKNFDNGSRNLLTCCGIEVKAFKISRDVFCGVHLKSHQQCMDTLWHGTSPSSPQPPPFSVVSNGCLHGRRNGLLRSSLLLSVEKIGEGETSVCCDSKKPDREKWQTDRKTGKGVRERRKMSWCERDRKTVKRRCRWCNRRRGTRGNYICKAEI